MHEFKSESISSCYLFAEISHFFTASEVVDYYIGKAAGLSLQCSLSMLEQGLYTINPLASLFAYLFSIKRKDPLSLELNKANIKELINSDGLKILISGIERLLNRLAQKDGASIQNEMSLKILLNIIYICIDYLQTNETNSESSLELNQLYADARLDDSLMKMVTTSLQAHYIPIKKLTMLYSKVLANIFHHKGSEKSKYIDPVTLYADSIIAKLPHDNLLHYGELEKYKVANPPPTGPDSSNKKVSSIQQFYRKHNTGECPLAQSIVVGLLRSLLTVCNCQSHKKFQTIKGSGVDSFREWQLSYRYILDRPQLHSAMPSQFLEHIRLYESFDHIASEGRVIKSEEQIIWGEFYSHKIYTTAAIASFFQLMLVALYENMFLQYSYFLQLISDANGILVFLKFLTDKFVGLENVKSGSPFRRGQWRAIEFREEVMLTIYSVLLMLFTSCNNYPEKIRNYLFQYNSYLIIKKIPTLFIAKGEEDLQTSQNGMPSREEIEMLGNSGSGTLRKLTQLCYDLLKIQIPFFSKKMKESTANMRMIIDIYCKYPRNNPPKTLTNLQKLLLKSKSGLVKQQKFITSVEQMKTIHNEYNNIYYWSNDFLQEVVRPPTIQIIDNFETLIDAEHWLEQNLWRYYD